MFNLNVLGLLSWNFKIIRIWNYNLESKKTEILLNI